MVRTVEEWIGRNDDAMPTDACKRRILDRQGWVCAVSGVEFRDGVKAEFDHITPVWLGGQNRESNLQAITRKAHLAKTKTEATVRAKVNANRIKRVGGKKKSSLSNPRFRKLMNGDVVDRRTGEIVS
ncbi:5-methylcytosine-specific restriction endonuclease McrA [Pararhizobium capsulatum DSM 1112]|uniref:5-methylcytosine-specific restriction endonuclease McrA n=1 Tax=Pararhizobium capsulatum DSM 1112 TaxID=1121113 RepID=A0ABU0BP13_9HYPH|nr:HNH endonuclease signature motif containing protein [Pararhizobium capsulatum]MDQ0319995.1 5-methylcytosine-specific restriction endonuclease McrA [Pararhizobium capsulatum DSM 1112]